MEKEKFYSYLDSADAKNTNSVDFFKSIVVKYPFFHGARILYLKALKENSSASFEEFLKENAGIIPDRRHLFYILNPTPNQISSKEEIVATKPVDIVKNLNDTNPSFILIEDDGANGIVLPDISDQTKDLLIPVSEFDLLEINDHFSATESIQDNSNDNGSKSKNNDLIDQFIKTNPRIKPPMIIQGDQEDISLSSLSEPEDLITEPLAKIYLSQGLIDKAISIYEKLSLKFPEKSSYFAGQIQEIKKENNKT